MTFDNRIETDLLHEIMKVLKTSRHVGRKGSAKWFENEPAQLELAGEIIAQLKGDGWSFTRPARPFVRHSFPW